MRTIARMNIEEMAHDVGYRCGRLNVPIKYATMMAYEFKEPELILKFLDGYNEAVPYLQQTCR